MELREGALKLDRPTQEITIYIIKAENVIYKAQVVKASQDKLGRVYIWVRAL
jgi:hypothetical protein